MRTRRTAAWIGGSSALAFTTFPVLVFSGMSGSTTSELCAPQTQAAPAKAAPAAAPDSRRAGTHINLPLAQADMTPPVPPDSIKAGDWTYPVPAPATVTARFGESGKNWVRGHTGTDFAPPAGTPVFAAADGVVMAATPGSAGHAFGNFVTVLHADNTVTVYGHLSQMSVARGQQVKAGSRIGAVGSSGNSTGPHLHFEVRPQIGGRHLPVNAEPYLTDATIPAATGTETDTGQATGAEAAQLCLPAADTAAMPNLARQMNPTIAPLLKGCPQCRRSGSTPR